MKRLNLLLVFFICVLPENVALAQKTTHPKRLKTWQEQLEYIKNRSSVSTSIGTDMNSIRWVGYTYKGRIKTETEKRTALERIFSDSSYIVRYIDSPNFEIVPIKTIRQESKEDVFANMKSQLEDVVRIGMELIDITWSYKGKTYYSTAIASNDHGGILYENIGYNIIESEEIRTNITTVNTPITAEMPIGEKQYVNLFSYGTRVEFSEANFMNLFRNLPLYIENSSEIKLMYYRYVGVLKNSREIKSYVKKSFPPYAPSWGYAANSGGSSKTGEFSTIRFTIEKDPFQKPEKYLIDRLINEYLHIGDEVWEVVFKLWDKEYHYYMFVDSNTHQIIPYCNSFGAPIPQSHIDYINRKLR